MVESDEYARERGVVICDTLGIATPPRMEKLAGLVKSAVRAEHYSFHFHDDLGLATSNTLAAVMSGLDASQATVCGIGERSGNAAFE